ncbi:hypothetical protein C4E22_03120 [ANME-1 cluster archaeon AG-394-G06]|nr:hypothetical protein [ANME-1 cluster archaeon AG-394-G06]
MPMVFKKREIKSALESKGFVKVGGKSHEFYVLMVNKKQSGIQTKLSHGNIEYSRNLLSYMRKQLKFNSINELEKFIKCDISGEQYIKILENNNQI